MSTYDPKLDQDVTLRTLIETWRREADTTTRMMGEKYPGELEGSEEAEDYYAMESRAETLRHCATEVEAALAGELDIESPASRQHRIDTGRFMTFGEQHVSATGSYPGGPQAEAEDHYVSHPSQHDTRI